MQLPEQGRTYTDAILQRCWDFIDADIWSGIDKPRLSMWMSNFSSPEERYFAARILDRLIYRPKSQVVSLLRQLFQRSLPPPSQTITTCALDQWSDVLATKRDYGARIVPVIRPKDPHGKSGEIIARHIVQSIGLKPWVSRMTSVASDISKVQVLIFVDDFLGTGRQFRSFFQEWNLAEYPSHIKMIYAPLVSHSRGLSKLREHCPRVEVVSTEMIDGSASIFSAHEDGTVDGLNTQEDVHDFYHEFLTSKGLHLLSQNELGYGRLGLTIAFEHAIPNASLPILWLTKNNFKPLFQR